MREGLPPDLQARLAAFVAAKPAARPLVDQLTNRHAAATSPRERQAVEEQLRGLVAPDRTRLGLGVALALVFTGIVGAALWTQQRHEAALERSVPAVALVTRTEPGDCTLTMSRKRCLRLELEVHRDGAAPYTGSLTHNIDLERLSRVQPGSWLTIGVNPDDASELLFDERALAAAPPAPAR
ncbi:hypothetical protein SAMN02745121_03209 [Nannocystis exedens]|uniref:Uncharacterized protein n=1 Tax=Nannocystis exedens TaxID=54 RepID=A0A1I1Y6P6_9BACT|nr:hypothetical protein [Nannocystis exedens]PCC71857.1 hypothetical protein NAEX_04936 [Nannocystis exedens]SFE15315.1 hypothetical protein SAMN02745121_03209 [Nannocystis exedens]